MPGPPPTVALCCPRLTARSPAGLSDVVASSGGSTINCPSTGVNLTIEFNVTVVAADPGVIDGSTVTFNVDDLEAMPTDFAIVLDLCDAEEGGAVVLSANYTDDQGNDPDLSALTSLVVDAVVPPTPSPGGTPSPTPIITPSPTMILPTPAAPTPGPTAMDTPAPSPIIPVDPTPAPSPAPTPDMPSMSPTSMPTMFSLPIP